MINSIEVDRLIDELENICLNKIVLSSGKAYFGKIKIEFSFQNGKEVFIKKEETRPARKAQ
jgi:hypothetical protein